MQRNQSRRTDECQKKAGLQVLAFLFSTVSLLFDQKIKFTRMLLQHSFPAVTKA